MLCMFRISEKTVFNFNWKSNIKFIFLYYFKYYLSFFYFLASIIKITHMSCFFPQFWIQS